MAYVGTPLDTTNAFQSLAGKRFSGDASTTDFTLDSSPNSTLDIEVFVENVRQDPNSAYTVSGTTLAFTAAPPSGTNNVYVVHQAKAVGTIDPAVGSTLDLNGAAELVLDADADTTIAADTDDQIDIRVAGTDQLTIKDGALSPVTDNDIDLGTSSLEFKDAYFDGTVTSDAGLFDTLGVVSAHDLGAGLHVKISDAGAISGGLNTDGDDLVVEHSGSGGISIITGTSSQGGIYFGDSGDADIGVIRYDHSANSLDFFTSGTEAMMIDSSGRLCIGHSSGAHTFHLLKNVAGDAVAAIENSNDSTPQGLDMQFTGANPDNNSQYAIHFGAASVGTKFVVYSDGDVKNHDNSYGSTSDQRIKDNIADASSQWDDIKALKVRKFKLKDDIREYGADKAKYKIGLVAQEAEAVSPNLISECAPGINDIKSDSTFGTLYEDGDDIPDGKNIGEVKEEKATVKSIKYSILYMKAIKALQEAQTRIETLETKVKTLEDA
mgnify:CR=1 FL=1|jgi:hypothetical protein